MRALAPFLVLLLVRPALAQEVQPQAPASPAISSASADEEEPAPVARTRRPMKTWPALRVAFGAGWLSGDAHFVFDAAAGVQIFRSQGFGTGAMLGMTRRAGALEWTALTLGAPFGYVAGEGRFAVGVRPDLLVGRGVGEPLVGGRASLYVAWRQSIFVEGGYERLRFDGAGHDGYRVVAGVDLGIVLGALALFGGSYLHR